LREVPLLRSMTMSDLTERLDRITERVLAARGFL